MNIQEFKTVGTFEIDQQFDPARCHTDPIERTALVQSHGVLFVLDPNERVIEAVSDNTIGFFDQGAAQFIGEPIESAFRQGLVAELQGKLKSVESPFQFLALDHLSRETWGRLFPIGEHVGLEIQKAEIAPNSAKWLMAEVNTEIAQIRQCEDRRSVYERTVRAIQRWTGYDRVMLYKFGETNHGEVVAEQKRQGLSSYLNHHFPASDIPEPARRLYRKNQLRTIRDIESGPVPVVGESGKLPRDQLDLTYSALRAVPNVHRRYLDNMGVQSSCSISLVVEGRLWGLIACHGLQSVGLGWDQRHSCRVFGHAVSQKIEEISASKSEQRYQRVSQFRTQIEGAWSSYRTFFERLQQHSSQLLSIVSADAFFLRLGGEDFWIGDSKAGEVVDPLLERIKGELEHQYLLSAQSIVNRHDLDWQHSEYISGYLAVQLSEPPDSFCVWFRPEFRRTLSWGGDPRQPFDVDDQGRLSPRNSFETWNQVVEKTARPWTELDHMAAREIALSFKASASEIQRSRLRQARQKLEKLNERKDALVEQIKETAKRDELTGLVNRRELLAQLNRELERASRYETPLSVAIIDLDEFKEVNDEYGHQQGDSVLERFGDILNTEVRESDTAGRYGGEEFAIILPHTGSSEAGVVAERVRSRLAREVFETRDSEIAVTCSIGVSEFEGESDSVDELIRRADRALYRAKRQGRDAVVHFDDTE